MKKLIGLLVVVVIVLAFVCTATSCGDDDKKPIEPTIEVTEEVTEEPTPTDEVVDTTEPEVTLEA